MDPLDRFIVVMISLFILSVITEKVTAFNRKYPFQCKVIAVLTMLYFLIVSIVSLSKYGKWYFWLVIGFTAVVFTFLAISFMMELAEFIASQFTAKPLAKREDWFLSGTKWVANYIEKVNPLKQIAKSDKTVSEEDKEKEVTLLSFFMGTAVAFAFQADLFKMFELADKDFEFAVWKESLIVDYVYFNPALQFSPNVLFGVLAAGFFLSFGSRFFHDLLDNLLQVKNLRRKLNEKETYRNESMQKLNTWLNLTENDILERLLSDNRQKLSAIQGVISVGLGYSDNSQRIQVRVLDSSTTFIPDSLPYTTPSGNVKMVPVDVIRIRRQPSIQLTPADEVSNGGANLRGTMSCIVTKVNDTTKPLFLSCYHVVKHPKHSYYGFIPQKVEQVVSPRGGNPVGTILEAVRNSEIDAAIMDFGLSVQVGGNVVPPIGTIKGRRKVNGRDVGKTTVNLFGTATGVVKTGKIVSVFTDVTLNYPNQPDNNQEWRLNNLFAVSDDQGKSLTVGGDSGAPVLDSEFLLLGIVVAGDDTCTYVIPIETILNHFNLTL